MRNFAQLIASLMLFAAQAASPIPAPAAASSQTPVQDETPVAVTFNTAQAQPLVAVVPVRPDFDHDQLPKLRAWQQAQVAAQAAAQAQAQAAAAAQATVQLASQPVVAAGATADNMLALRLCESGSTYTRNSGNGYYGAYQYDIGTWANFDGYARPDLAPADVQDAKFLQTFADRGWSPWPACSRKLGLL